MIYFLIALLSLSMIARSFVTRMENKEIRAEIERLKTENTMLDYRISALMKEIDYHLHENSDELANSYFANCKELRESKDASHSYDFRVWSGK